MENMHDIKALFIIINAGFTNEVMEIARVTGADGATIINSRGEGTIHKLFMGITIDFEKEILLTLVSEDIAEKIMAEIKEKMGIESPAHSICFISPVEKVTLINTHAKQQAVVSYLF